MYSLSTSRLGVKFALTERGSRDIPPLTSERIESRVLLDTVPPPNAMHVN